MGLIIWSEEKIQNLTTWDFALVKIAVGIFGILIGAYISTFVKQYVWYFIIIFIVAYAILLSRIFKKK